jgi:outer membrane protein TolC
MSLIALLILQAVPLTPERLEARILEIEPPPEATLEIRLAFEDLVLATRKLEIRKAERAAWERLIRLDEARFGEGAIAERDLIRARIEGGLLDLEVSDSGTETSKARRRLAALLGARDVELDVSTAEADFPRLHRAKLPPGRDDVAAAAEDYESARERIRTYRLRLRSSAEESVGIEELLYQQLKTGLVTLLEARRTRLSIELGYVETLHRAAVARWKLLHLLGGKDLPT